MAGFGCVVGGRLVAAGWPVAGFPPRALAGVPTFSGCFRPAVGGFPANAQTGKTPGGSVEEAFRESGHHRNCHVADPVSVSWGSLQDGQKSKPFERQFVGTPANAQNHDRDKAWGNTRPQARPALAWVPTRRGDFGPLQGGFPANAGTKNQKKLVGVGALSSCCQTLPNVCTMLSLPRALAGKPLQMGQK